MQLYYHREPSGNFGDDLNVWLWPRLIPALLDPNDGCLFVGIGTILDERVPVRPQKAVFGAGTGYRPPPALDQAWKIYCVRGPLTAAALGLRPSMAITDPAALVRLIAPPRERQAGRVSFVPHHTTMLRASIDDWDIRSACEAAGVALIDPRWQVEDVLPELQASSMVIAEAMHAAILADTFRIPWIPVQLYPHVLEGKWRDWCQSLCVEYAPTRCSPAARVGDFSGLAAFLDAVLRSDAAFLSRDTMAQQNLERLSARLGDLTRDYMSGQLAGGRGLASRQGAEAGVVSSPAVVEQDSQVDSSSEAEEWLGGVFRASRDIAALIPPDSRIILVDQDEWRSLGVADSYCVIPFMERGGHFWGPPPDDATAIFELERLRRGGAAFIVFARPAFWWLEHYAGLHRHLVSNFVCSLKNDRVIVFALSAIASKRAGRCNASDEPR